MTALELQALTKALAEIKALCLTAGSPGHRTPVGALSRIVRLCIDAGIDEKLAELPCVAVDSVQSPIGLVGFESWDDML